MTPPGIFDWLRGTSYQHSYVSLLLGTKLLHIRLPLYIFVQTRPVLLTNF
jgi:hypothetical protein